MSKLGPWLLKKVHSIFAIFSAIVGNSEKKLWLFSIFFLSCFTGNQIVFKVGILKI